MAIRDYLNWFGAIIGVVGIVVSVILYLNSRSYRAPEFAVDPNRTEIVSAEGVSDAPIRVLREDGTEITSNLYSVRFYFWNDGPQAIKPASVLRPLRIAFRDSTVEIIDHKILWVSREVTSLDVKPDTSKPAVLSIDFDILEQNDGFTGQLLYQGDRNTELELLGVVENARSSGSSGYASTWNILSQVALYIGVLILFIVIFLLTVPKLAEWFAKKMVRFTDKVMIMSSNYASNVLKFIIGATVAIILIISSVALYFAIAEDMQDRVSEYVPREIVPQHTTE